MTRPLRILHVTPYCEPAYVYGGPARSVPALCRALASAGATADIVTTTANGETEVDLPSGHPIDRGGITITYVRRARRSGRFLAPGMRQVLRVCVREYDLVHISGLWTYPAAIAAAEARQADVPSVISPRGMLMPWELSHKRWKKAAYLHLRELPRLHRAAGIHCTSEFEREALRRFGLHAHAFVVPNVVDPGGFDSLPCRGALRARLDIPQNAFVLLFLGRLHAKKGIEDTLEMFRHLEAGDDVHLVLAGPDEGGYTETIIRWAESRGLAGRVHLTGPISGAERLQAFADADLFIALSASENFGLSVAEAMAARLPVVVRAGTGLSGWIEEAGAGLIVGGDARQTAASVATVLGEPRRLYLMGAAGRTLVDTTFAPLAVASSMLAEYGRMVGRTHRPETAHRVTGALINS